MFVNEIESDSDYNRIGGRVRDFDDIPVEKGAITYDSKRSKTPSEDDNVFKLSFNHIFF